MKKSKKVFRNQVVDKKELKKIMSWAFSEFGMIKSSYLANKLKDLGFEYATQSGLSISIEDLRVPPIKTRLIKAAKEKVDFADFQVNRGEITESERFQKVIYTWNITSESLKDQVVQYFEQSDPLNSIYMMAFSGARGNLSQVRQLVGMRGLMADPNGQILDLPIVTNFREGLTVTDYIISSYGARKGLVDTALRTADSGYLTRRLIDVAQDMVTREKNCKTQDGISLQKISDGESLVIALSERILGRFLALPLKDLQTNQWIAKANEEITLRLTQKIDQAKITKVVVRSPLTCSSNRSVCQQCYGWNLAYGSLIDLGEAVGIIAAQSIGEPGTQLTMRTFHTGGVFTTEPSRQIRAEFSGKVIFSKDLKVKQIRTQYGEVAFLSENKGSLALITYKNKSLFIEVLPETLILVQNHSYVKKHSILFELMQKTKNTGGEKAYQYVAAGLSGEVLLENQKGEKNESPASKQLTSLVWILSGQVYDVPLRSTLQGRIHQKRHIHQSLAETKIISLTCGRLKFLPAKKAFGILYSLGHLQNQSIYLEENHEKLFKAVIYGAKNRKIQLDSFGSIQKIKQKDASIGSMVNLNYSTKTGGRFYSKQFSSNEKTKMGGTIFYLAQSTYSVDQKKDDIFVKNGERIKAGTEIFTHHFASISGIVEVSQHKKKVKEITIKPGSVFSIEKEKSLKNFHQSLVYPGELLFDTILISQLSFTEIKVYSGQTFLKICPVVRYEIVHDPKELFYFIEKPTMMQSGLGLGHFESCLSFEKMIKASRPLILFQRQVLCQPLSKSKAFSLKVNFLKKSLLTKKISLSLLVLDLMALDTYFPQELKKTSLKNPLLSEPHQYVEAYTKLASFQVLSSQKKKPLQLKEQVVGKNRKLYLASEDDFKKVFLEEPTKGFEKHRFIQYKEKINNHLLSKNSALLSQNVGSLLFLQKGQSYLFSKGASIKKKPGDLIQKGEGLGQLIYKRAKTGDIVQGLPRVEEILEGRKPKTEASLIAQPGIITAISQNASFTEVQYHGFSSEPVLSIFENSSKLLLSKYDFVHVGQPLNSGPINPHNILETYFIYYKSFENFKRKEDQSYKAAFRSLRKIQSFLLNSVQAVYQSQGVHISDKHVELIIKRMTAKVQILEAGGSKLFVDEFVDLKQAYYINTSLEKNQKAVFQPTLFGITKASLSTNSFISAASFQNTTRILTEAAIQGKTDWLRGLKENVIVGRLIPAGTGFNAYSDISHICVKVPALLDKVDLDSRVHKSRRMEKYKEAKNKIKFKRTNSLFE